MRAILVDRPHAPLTLTHLPDPEPPAHGAIVAVAATGVCRSDHHAWLGHDPTIRWPHVPGHEFAGTIVALGRDVRARRVGERVTAPFCCGCGTCGTCREGHVHLCEQEFQPGFDGYGSFAELVAVPWADVNLAVLPEALDFDAAASLGCRFMTAFHGLIERARLRAGERVAVFGCGGVGLSAVAIAAAAGAEVIAVDLAADRLALARSLGAAATIDAGASDPVAAIRDLCAAGPGKASGADVAVDALGSRATARSALASLRRRGRHLQLGLLLGDDTDPPLPIGLAVRHELTLIGAHGMPATSYPALFRFVQRSGIHLEQLIGSRRPLAEAHDAMLAMGRFAGAGVTLLRP
jgi:alcohol dehydrogenase